MSIHSYIKYHNKITEQVAVVSEKLSLYSEIPKEINELITRDILKNCFLSEDLNVKTGDAELTKILESLENRDALFEALPDYIQYKGAKIANSIIRKYGFGQTKNAAAGKLAALKDMDAVLADWSQLTRGNEATATAAALKAYLVGKFKINEKIVNDIIKKYKPRFITTPQSILNLKTTIQNPGSTSQNQQIPKTPGFLPKSQLRSFFLDAINAQRQAILKPSKKAKSTTTAPKQIKTTAQVKKTNNNITNLADELSKLPQNQRSQAILSALPVLDDQSIKDVLNALVTKPNG